MVLRLLQKLDDDSPPPCAHSVALLQLVNLLLKLLIFLWVVQQWQQKSIVVFPLH